MYICIYIGYRNSTGSEIWSIAQKINNTFHDDNDNGIKKNSVDNNDDNSNIKCTDDVNKESDNNDNKDRDHQNPLIPSRINKRIDDQHLGMFIKYLY
jgi:hypothetical protein